MGWNNLSSGEFNKCSRILQENWYQPQACTWRLLQPKLYIPPPAQQDNKVQQLLRGQTDNMEKISSQLEILQHGHTSMSTTNLGCATYPAPVWEKEHGKPKKPSLICTKTWLLVCDAKNYPTVQNRCSRNRPCSAQVSVLCDHTSMQNSLVPSTLI